MASLHLARVFRQRTRHKIFPTLQLSRSVEDDAKPGKTETKRLLDDLKISELETAEDQPQTTNKEIRSLLSQIKIYQPTDDRIRKKLGMPPLRIAAVKQETAASSNLVSEGPRLNWFERHSEGDKVMPPFKPCFLEQERDRQVEALLMFKPTNAFEELIKDAEHLWTYPIDNEADRGEEENVGFEEHVLLDHLINEGFPRRGPVRHFMELVVEGLSRNPHYSPAEKRSFIEGYQRYFSQFPQEELETSFPHEAGEMPSFQS